MQTFSRKDSIEFLRHFTENVAEERSPKWTGVTREASQVGLGLCDPFRPIYVNSFVSFCLNKLSLSTKSADQQKRPSVVTFSLA